MPIVVVVPALLLLTAVLTQLAASGVLGKNPIAGIRVRSTLRSPGAWVAGHRAAAPWTWIGFALSAVACVAALLLTGLAAAIAGIAVVVVFALTIVVSLVTASRSAGAENRRPPTAH
ncbi:SdpI family protein [Microbacterium sp. SORGH_AS_0888]|uniref:SdpI family protein n=1 Tax=Microbacterium sp. SORGH_AS_0888 TaxID=3041791 RepID=UPI00277F3792|nr:SdpI family protein [Microbacterium sp. SORGH_AS_0888]MDQ1128239.1 putative membrane protein [Microbacterium sp. SORGH_AS_0888]